MLTPESFLEHLQRLPEPAAYQIAYSGGRDSHVLLHLMAGVAEQLMVPVMAVHIDHGLQQNSSRWARHCVRSCNNLGISCHCIELNLTPITGESLEAQARDVRYRALADWLGNDELLLTAHHRQDQAETVLLQLLRGAGPAGLSAMPRVSPLGRGYLGRPLLEFDAAAVAGYAQSRGLCWVEDPSNRETRFDRNYLRREVIPLLTARWPAMARTLSRSARHCAEAQTLIDELAAGDLQQVRDAGGPQLSLSALSGLSPPRARAVLRAWVRQAGFQVPDSARLDRLLHEMIGAAVDRNPMVHWSGTEVRRYRDRLYLMAPLQPLSVGEVLSWDGVSPLPLPAGLGRLRVGQGIGGIRAGCWNAGPLEIRFGRLSGRLRLAGEGRSRSVKQLFQERAVPPWERSRLPLIYLRDELAAVADLWVCEPFGSGEGEPGMGIEWER